MLSGVRTTIYNCAECRSNFTSIGFVQETLQHAVPVATPAPPWAVSFLMEALMTPELEWDLVPDLLRSLGQLEVWRVQCIEVCAYTDSFKVLIVSQEAEVILNAEDVKASPRYHHRVPPHLSPQQRQRLERFVQKAASARAKYRILVLQICYAVRCAYCLGDS